MEYYQISYCKDLIAIKDVWRELKGLFQSQNGKEMYTSIGTHFVNYVTLNGDDSLRLESKVHLGRFRILGHDRFHLKWIIVPFDQLGTRMLFL